MVAAVLVKHGRGEKAFEIKEVPDPVLSPGCVKIKVEAFGLNFADVMARLGLYQDCPPLPTVIGYDVVGIVTDTAQDVSTFSKGDRVVALTRFGGYAQYAVADERACARLSPHYDATKATALSTQYCTAWYCLEELTCFHEHDSILVHAAAGGLGIALVQLALHKKLNVYATAGSKEKIAFLTNMGVAGAIDYKKQDYAKEIKRISGRQAPLDACFNSIGGKMVGKDIRLLRPGGREVLLGIAQMSSASLIGKIGIALQFGFYHPFEFMTTSRSLMGVNMLKIADNNPAMIGHCLNQVVQLAQEKKVDPHIGGSFSIQDLSKAHTLLENRGSMGKIAVYWDK